MKANEAYSIEPSPKQAQEEPTFNERLPPVYSSQPDYSTVYYDRVGWTANVGFRHIVDGVVYEVPAQ